MGIRGQCPRAVRLGCVASTRAAWAVFAVAQEAWQPGSLSWSRNGSRSSTQLVSVYFLSPPPPLSGLLPSHLSPGCPPSPNILPPGPTPPIRSPVLPPEHPANRVISPPCSRPFPGFPGGFQSNVNFIHWPAGSSLTSFPLAHQSPATLFIFKKIFIGV